MRNILSLASILFSGLIFLAFSAEAQKKFSITGPDKKISVKIEIADSVYYQVLMDNKSLISKSAIALKTSNAASGWQVSKSSTSAHDAIVKPVVWQKSKEVRDQYNLLHIDFKNGLALEWKVFENGVAWRWINNNTGAYQVLDEVAKFNLSAAGKSWYPQEDKFFSHNERAYKNYKLSELDEAKLASLPALFEVDGTKILLTEADLFDYAGMWLRGTGKGGVKAVFPTYPKVKKVTSDRDEEVLEREAYLAKINGAKTFPWRILMLARSEKDILVNQMPLLLGRPAKEDFSWVKPGKVQWDWWHYNNITGVNFKAGINNETYKYYIDFAAKNNLEYVLLDEGWCDTKDLMKQSPGINVEELAKYAKSKNVDLLLWTSWLVLDKQLDQALDQFEKWGIKGVKVDFMQRDDQDMVNYYEKVAKAAAKRKMLVDFHGAYKPTGWLRTYPNILTSEGVLGNEISKFASSITPTHTATLPFIRMAAGPMDFTPGGMRNVQKDAFAAVPAEPMTLGTRCNQLAMYVIYESPLQMLCDIPTHYYEEPEAMEFLKAVPVVWAETVPLEAKIGEYVSMARKAANGDWFIGGMSDWNAREMTLDFSFLPAGSYEIHLWKDGVNADQNARDFSMEKLKVDKNTRLKIKLAKGGGFVGRIISIDPKKAALALFNNIKGNFYEPATGLYFETNEPAKDPNKHSWLWPLCALIQAANEMETIDPKTDYMSDVVKAIDQYYNDAAPAPAYQDYVTKERLSSRFFDDNQWIAIAYLDAYQRNKKPFFLDKAKMIYTHMIKAGLDTAAGGGLYWKEGEKDTKNTCSNGPGILVALELYKVTKDQSYLDMALQLYQWTNKNLQSPEGIFYDAIKIPSLKIDPAFYTYNTGSMLQSNVLLYELTNDKKYLEEAQRIAAAGRKHFFKDGRLPSHNWFNAVMLRGYEALYKVDGNKRWIDFFQEDASNIWRDERDKNNLLGTKSEKSLIDQAGMAEIMARLERLK